jgi:tight adherence protein B
MAGTSVVVAVIAGMLTGAGLWLAATGFLLPAAPGDGLTASMRGRLTRTAQVHLTITVAVGLLVLVVTRWPVAALLAGMFAWAAPALLGSGRHNTTAQSTLDALASWTDALRGRLRSYAGIEQAIRESAAQAKAPIRPHTIGLAAALSAGVRLPDALAGFRADVDHHGADLVAVALEHASTSSGGLAAQLGRLSVTMRERVAMWQRVETARAESQSSARIVVLIVAAVGVGLWLFNRPLLAPFDKPSGQLVLLMVGGIWTLATVYLHRLSRMPDHVRVLQAPTRTPGRAPSEAPSGSRSHWEPS